MCSRERAEVVGVVVVDMVCVCVCGLYYCVCVLARMSTSGLHLYMNEY